MLRLTCEFIIHNLHMYLAGCDFLKNGYVPPAGLWVPFGMWFCRELGLPGTGGVLTQFLNDQAKQHKTEGSLGPFWPVPPPTSLPPSYPL